MNNDYMTIPQLMEYIHVSRKTAYTIVACGKIPAYRPSPRKTLVKRADVDKYVNKYKL